VWVDALEAVLGTAGITVVGKATTAAEALALVDENDADLLVADLRLGNGVSGSTCIREALKRHPDLKAVVVSGFDDASSIDEALASGAAAFVSKAARPEDVLAAVRQVFDHVFILANAPQRTWRSRRRSERLPRLTRREAEILELVAEGHSNAQVARMLWITEQTVKFHLSNVFRKLGVSNRTEATRWVHVQQEEEPDVGASMAW
jgi:DNA-binding NarL/FixJ family response regulator